MIEPASLQTLLNCTFATTNLALPGRLSGKVRDSYALSATQRLLITTDRLSAFDRVLGCVPYKGQVLNQLAAWWFEQTADIIPNHVVALPDPNALIAIAATPFRVEVIVRGYITGVTATALWQRYAAGERTIYGHTLPDGLQKNQALPTPIITPTTKGDAGAHDERLTCAEVISTGLVDAASWAQIQTAALALFERGQTIARTAGLILVDTKYEFGRDAAGRLLLIDEIHTPDSSRYWRAASYAEHFAKGEEPENFDKEFIRLAYVARGQHQLDAPPPLTADLQIEASLRYIKSYELLTGQTFVPGAYPVLPRLQENLRAFGLAT